MSRTAHSTYATYAGDAVADRALSLIGWNKAICEYQRLVPGAPTPLGTIVIIHRPGQPGYVMVEGGGTTFRVYIRESRTGSETRRFKKAIKRIPTIIKKRAESARKERVLHV